LASSGRSSAVFRESSYQPETLRTIRGYEEYLEPEGRVDPTAYERANYMQILVSWRMPAGW
jgi:hypothetical protein